MRRIYGQTLFLSGKLINNRALLRTAAAAQKCNYNLPAKINVCHLQSTQRRWYASTPATACWNCKQSGERREHMICAACGYLQDVNSGINYFDLLKFPPNFSLEAQALTKRFRQLQTLVHPDKFSNKSSREQANSADWSSLINKAYKTLATPIERGQYLLQLQGEQMPQDNSALNTEFLLDMMERNEQVDEAATNSSELHKINEQIMQELDEKVNKLNAQFEAQNLDAAKSILVEMKYLLSLQSSIKKKLQNLMESS